MLVANEGKFKAVGTTNIGSSYDLCEMALDKMRMYKWLMNRGYNCARYWMEREEFNKAVDAGEVSYPVFVKPIEDRPPSVFQRSMTRKPLIFSLLMKTIS